MKTLTATFPPAIALCLGCLLLCSPAAMADEKHAYVRGNTPGEGVKIKIPNGNVTVKSYRIQMVESDLAGILAGPGYAVVDVVLSQCFAGAFLDAVKKNPPAGDWTGAAACSGEEPSFSLHKLVPPAVEGPVDNFTRAWREDALRQPATGMKQHFDTALNGNANPKILADPFAPSQTVIHQIIIKMKQYGNYMGKNPVTGEPMIMMGLKPGTDNTPHYFDAYFGTEKGILGWWFKPDPFHPDMFPINPATGVPDPVQITPKPGPDPGGKWLINGKEYDYAARAKDETEHPLYASKGGTSDSRTLALPNPNNDNIQQYAVLVQWDQPVSFDRQGTVTDKRGDFAADISRMYDVLVNTYTVPAANIAVLYDNGKYDDGTAQLPAFTLDPGPNGQKNEKLAVVPINTYTGYAADQQQQFVHAVKGDLFGAKPADFTKCRLLVFFTGHGARNNVKKTGVLYEPDPNYIVTLEQDVTTDANGNVTATGFDGLAEFEQELITSLASTNNDDLSFGGILYNTNNILDDLQDSQTLIQISTTQLIPYGVPLVVNGYTNPGSLLPVSDTNAVVYDLDPFVPGLLTNTYTYQVSVPSLALYNPTPSGINPGDIDLSFPGLPPTSFEPGLVAAVILRGAAQELAYITPDFTTTSALSAQRFGGGILLTWPAGQTGYNIMENDDLTTSNWVRVNNPVTGMPEVTGTADPNLPMGTNWAFFAYTVSHRFFKLVPAP
ncbi:MAG: hypothetical protein C5B50_07195 [Verrucomicrobia bacterium]|nr:MAG: hypothetical protein C5B50_07195 [Verrucomicrobiota bacterium]